MTPAIARIEELQRGRYDTFTKTFTEDDLRFIEITRDTNPIHVDEAFAASSGAACCTGC